MIQAKSKPPNFCTELKTPNHTILSDVSVDNGGAALGMGPHELLEAALASCMQITLQMGAAKYGFNPGTSSCQVELDRSLQGKTTFVYKLHLDPSLTPEQVDHMRRFAAKCPVRKTLSAEIGFREV
jgi:putative redox protein